MAGIGVRLNRIFEKNTLTTNLVGFFYSTVVTVAPMFVIIINLILMEYLLDFASVGYVTRELFSCTILYTFIFSLLTASPFNAVLSRYMSDVKKYPTSPPTIVIDIFPRTVPTVSPITGRILNILPA